MALLLLQGSKDKMKNIRKLEAMKIVCTKKSELMEQGIEDLEMMQMLNMLELVLKNMDTAYANVKMVKSEMTHYRRFANLLDGTAVRHDFRDRGVRHHI